MKKKPGLFGRLYLLMCRGFVGAALVFVATPVSAQFITLGTGGVTGVYYPAGGAICRLVNQEQRRHGLRCSVESTGGSLANLARVSKGELDLGIAQTDWLYFAHRGRKGKRSIAADARLRTLFHLYPEFFTVVARADAGISHFDQIRGKRVSIGKPGSGQRATLELLMDAKGWALSDFASAVELDPADQASALCAGEIDVMIYTLGHPSGATKEVTRDCDSRLLEVSGEDVERMIERNPFYTRAEIPAGLYLNNPLAVKTLGVQAAFFSSTDTADQVVYEVVRSVFEQFERFQQLHPAFAHLQLEAMISGPFSAPLHPGALRYYRERGWR